MIAICWMDTDTKPEPTVIIDKKTAKVRIIEETERTVARLSDGIYLFM